MTITFSVIIPTFRRPQAVLQKLQNITAWRYPSEQFEVIVVSNDPADTETAEVVKRMKKKLPRLRYVSEARQGASLARNTGIAHAEYDHFVFLDDDVWVSNDILRGYADGWRKYPQARVLGGKTDVRGKEKLSPEKLQMMAEYPWCFGVLDWGDVDQVAQLGDLVYAGNMSYKRKKKNETPVFHPKLGVAAYGLGRIGCEDFEICTRVMLAGGQVVRLADPATAITNDVGAHRFTDSYLEFRHYLSGIEVSLMEYLITQQFPDFRSFYLRFQMTKSGIKSLIKHKHKRTMLRSYLLNRQFFPKPE